MPRLPAYTDNSELNTGSQFMRLNDAPLDVARGLSALGGDIQALGNTVRQNVRVEEAKSQANAERVSAAQAVMNFSAFERTETERLRAETENIDTSGANFHRNFMEEHQKRALAFYDSLDEDAKTRLGPHIQSTISKFDDDAYKIEQQKVARVAGDALKTATENATTGIAAGRDPSEARLTLYAAIDMLALPENRAAEARKLADQAVDGAVIQKFIKDNPGAAERELRDQALGVPTALSSEAKTGYDAAMRHGHDPRLMAMIGLAESGFKPTLGNKHSTAYGMYQLIDGDWAETGIPKTSDPALQSEAMARRLTFLKNALERNGLELTPSAVYGSHFMGRAGFVHVAKADPNANFLATYAQVAGQKTAIKAVTGNRALMGDGTLTNAQVLARVANYANGRYNEAVKMLGSKTDLKPDELAVVNGQQMQALTRGQLAEFLTTAEKAQSEVVAEESKELIAAQVKALKDGTSSTIPNAYDSEFRDLLKKQAENTQMHDRLLSDEKETFDEAIVEAVGYADTYGLVPKPATAAIQALMSSPDPGKRQVGFELAARVHAADPIRGLEHSGFESEMRKDVERYTAWLSKDVSSADAIARVDRERENIKKNTSVDFTKRIKDSRAERTWEEIEEIDFTGTGVAPMREGQWNPFVTNVDRTPQDEITREFLVEAYRDNYEFHLKSGVSDEQAVRSAQMDVRRMFGTTKLFGREQNTLFPPEKIYPADADKSHAYVERQALELAQQFVDDHNRRNIGREIEIEDPAAQVMLRPTAQTAADYAARRLGRTDRLPAMQLIIFDQSGIVHGPIDFRPDPALEARRTKEAKADPMPKKSTRSALLEEARKKVEATEGENREFIRAGFAATAAASIALQ